MRLLKFLIPLLALIALGIFVYGTLDGPGQAFIISKLVPNLAPSQDEPIVLLFAGDIMMDRGVKEMIRRHGNGNPRYPYLKIADTLRSADLTVGNLEGPISSRGTEVGSIYSFRHPIEWIDGLTFAGLDVISLANNHIWDYGQEALEDTLDLLRNSGIAPVGTGRDFKEANAPYIADVRDTKIAFLAYTNLYPISLWAGADGQAGVSTPELSHIRESIAAVRSQVDLVVVLWHWGEEYEPTPSASQRSIARALVDAGADLIVGTHPHVTQEIEEYKDKFIAYSLGNFVFDQGFSEETMRSFMLHVVVRNKEIESVVPFPIALSETFQPYVGWRNAQLLKNYPFESLTPPVEIVEGFSLYDGNLGDEPGSVHRGADYVRRENKEYLPFDVFAMHEGEAMHGESKTWGNFVIVRKTASPTLRYYTVYAHLSNVPKNIPLLSRENLGSWDGIPIGAGGFLGRAGTSGNTKGITQLHIELQEEDLETGQWLKLDPYGAYDRVSLGAYPQPGKSLVGLRHYWTSNDPLFIK